MVSKLSFLGRIVYTILSLEVLFFFYNFVVQSILLFPGPLYDMENKFFKSIFFDFYFLFVIFSPIVLIIPTYEFISFPYLFYNDPYMKKNNIILLMIILTKILWIGDFCFLHFFCLDYLQMLFPISKI